MGVGCFSIFTSCRFPGCIRTKSQSRSQSEYCLHSVCILSSRCFKREFPCITSSSYGTERHIDSLMSLYLVCIRLSVVLSCWYCGTTLFPPYLPHPPLPATQSLSCWSSHAGEQTCQHRNYVSMYILIARPYRCSIPSPQGYTPPPSPVPYHMSS